MRRERKNRYMRLGVVTTAPQLLYMERWELVVRQVNLTTGGICFGNELWTYDK